MVEGRNKAGVAVAVGGGVGADDIAANDTDRKQVKDKVKDNVMDKGKSGESNSPDVKDTKRVDGTQCMEEPGQEQPSSALDDLAAAMRKVCASIHTITHSHSLTHSLSLSLSLSHTHTHTHLLTKVRTLHGGTSSPQRTRAPHRTYGGGSGRLHETVSKDESTNHSDITHSETHNDNYDSNNSNSNNSNTTSISSSSSSSSSARTMGVVRRLVKRDASYDFVLDRHCVWRFCLVESEGRWVSSPTSPVLNTVLALY